MVDFGGREVARFSETATAHILDILRGAYAIRTCDGAEDEVLADFIEALDECDSIEIADDEMLVDAD
jgi:hypothetical protein